MSEICGGDDRCYLIDSSAFALFYEGIMDDMNDEDISHKFFGDFEPTLMQSLLEKEFFVGESNTNHLSNTVDIAYVADAAKIAEHSLDSVQTPFALNDGTYSLHQVTGTNLFVVHIAGFDQQSIYPGDCSDNAYCSLVQSPGCIVEGDACLSASANVCDEPDVPAESEAVQCVATNMNDDHSWILTQQSDMCASNFLEMEGDVGADDEDAAGGEIGVIITCVVIIVLCCGFVMWCRCRAVRKNEAKANREKNGRQAVPSDSHNRPPNQPVLMHAMPSQQRQFISNQSPGKAIGQVNQYMYDQRGNMLLHSPRAQQNNIAMAAPLYGNQSPLPNIPPPAYNPHIRSSADEGSTTDC